MIPNETPLTAEQSAFAAEHHELIGAYLRLRRLPVDEYYDTVVFGYLWAVRRYCTMPVLHKYKFATIAYHAMMCDLGNHFRAQRAAKRDAMVWQLDEDCHAAELDDPVPEQAEHRLALRETEQALARYLTGAQSKIIYLKAAGYSNLDAAKTCGIRPKTVRAELEAARDNIVRFAPALLDRAA